MECHNFYYLKWNIKFVLTFLAHFMCVLLVLPNFSVKAIANSYYDPSISFPDEKPDFVRVRQNYQFQRYQNKVDSKNSEQIVFPMDSESERPQHGNYRPRPYLYSSHSTSRKKQVLDSPYRRHSAVSTSTHVQKPAKYFPYVPEGESESTEVLMQSKPLLHSKLSRFKNLTKRLPTSDRILVPSSTTSRTTIKGSNLSQNNDDENSQELLNTFLRWVEKCAPLPKISSTINANSSPAVKKNGINATAYSLDEPLNDTDCEDDHERDGNGDCKPTVNI